MGVPKFYRWLSERYPLINQRHGVRPGDDLAQEHMGRTPSDALPRPDPLSTCGLPPPIDRLYIDMNGIIHGCSHNNQSSVIHDAILSDEDGGPDTPDENAVADITEPEIFRNIAYYLDRIVKEIAQPRELMYIAIDGVAPRAKLNQQRARRYRSAQEGEIERTVYDAHRQSVQEAQEQQQQQQQQSYGTTIDDETAALLGSDDLSGLSSHPSLTARASATSSGNDEGSGGLREVEPGRFAGKFETTQTTPTDAAGSPSSLEGHHAQDSLLPNGNDSTTDDAGDDATELFHSNYITPGTPFFQRCTAYLEDYLRDKVANDPAWQHLQVILSGPNTPGEGEHKIMQFMREQKQRPEYDPNLRHCIMGQDGDLIMLGLVTHEPNLMLLREQVLFDKKRRAIEPLAQKYGLDLYLFSPNFEFLHMNVLRDYIALELETSNVVSTSPFDLERTIDDFVFLTFFVGNDFLPHMPALDIGDEALDLLLFRYRSLRQNWFEEYQKDPESTPEPYLTHAGEIVSGKRLEHFLQSVGKHESNYYAYKEKTTDYDQLRKTEAKFGEVVTPSDDVLEAKEDADRHNYRQLVHQALQQGNGAVPSSMSSAKSSFIPVMASQLQIRENSDDIEEGEALEKQMGDLLQYSLGDKSKTGSDDGKPLVLDETDFKGRYYADKFGFSPYDADSHLALRKAYIEGLVWNLRYYYQSHHTNLNWEWFYPYHYGPMISDLVHLDSILAEVSSSKREMGAPLKPFEQLLACLPASQSKLLPLPYQELMTEPNSPIRDFYPESFTVDMNGKRWPWEAVVLLPFIDSGLLRESAARIDATHLTSEELARNKFSDAQVISREPGDGKSVSVPLQESSWRYIEGPVEPSFRPVVDERTVVPLDGLPTLRDGSIQCMERKKLRLNVHGNRSRYRTAVLEIASEIPELVPLEALSSLVGGTVYINYPSLIESFVTAVSNSRMLCRGQDPPKPWSSREAMLRRDRVGRIVGAYSKGLGMTGTGGLALPGNEAQFDRETLLNVRPLKGLKTLSDGTVVKTFAKYELEVPLFALSWAPVNEDTRLKGIPLQLELDPYHCAKRVLTDVSMSPRRSDPPGHQFSARGDGNTFDVAARRTSYMNSRSFSTLPLTTERLLGRPFYKAATIAVAEPGLAAPARVVRRFPNHRGRFIAAGLLWVAAFSGIKLAQASSSFSTNPQSAHAFVASTAKMNTGIVGTTATQEDSLYHPLADRRAPPLDFLHGTTTVSFKYQGGIVAAVDSRASLGNYIGSKTTQKVLPIHPSALGTMAGGAADCTFWIRRLAAEAALYAVENDGRRMSIARASRLLANSLYQNRGAGLSIGTMIMGYDSDPGSPARIYYVDNSGMRIEGDMFAVGSGSTYAQGILDTEHRFDMTDEEAISLGLKAIRHATFRDAGSGGFINVYLVKQDAWRHVFRQDIAATAAHLTDKPKQEDRTAS